MEHKKPAALRLGKICRWPMALACRSAVVVLVMTSGLWPIAAHAEIVPPHIVSMTKELLLATRDDFKAATGNDEQAQRLQRIYRILRREGLYNWRLKPVTRDGFVPKMAAVFGLSQLGSAETEKFKKFLEAQTGGRSDAAIDELYTALGRARATGAERKRVVDGWNALWAKTWTGVALTYEMEASRGPQTISLAWDMDRARFTIRVLEEGDATTQKMQTTITGLVGFAFDQKARNLIVSVRPAQMPITSGNPDIQSATAQPRLGPPVKKKDKASDEKEAKNDKNEKGKGKTSADERSDKQEQIDAKRRRIEEIKSDKAHVWENTETKEKIRQKWFRKLKEPFAYKGKGYATDEAENEVARLEKEIATLESGITPAPDERTARLGSLTGPVISLAKRLYYHDEPIVIRYSFPPSYEADGWVKVLVTFSAEQAEHLGASMWLYPQEGTKELWFPLHAGLAFLDVEIEVRRVSGMKTFGPSTEIISTKYIRIVRREPPLPGAMRIAGGAIHPFGQPVHLDVHIPTDRFARTKEEHNRHGKRNFFLKLVRKGNRVRGNAITIDSVGALIPVTEMVQRIDLTNVQRGYGISSPGEYEIQLVTDDFIVDRKRLTMTVDELPNALRLVSTEPLRGGTSFDVVFDAPKLLPKFQYVLQEVRVYDDGHVNNRGRWYPWEPGKPKRMDARLGGNWAVRLMLVGLGRYYILDQLDFRIGGAGLSPTRSLIYINNQPAQGAVVPSGVKIPVTIALKGNYFWPGSSITARLYAIPADAPKKPQREYAPKWGPPIKEWGPPIQEWSVIKEGFSTLNIERNLPAGRYGMALSWKQPNETIAMENGEFYVTGNPKDAQIDLGEERTFSYDQPIPITLKLPEGFSPDDPRLSLRIEYVGGHVPGCAIEVIPSYTGSSDGTLKVDLKGQTSVTVKPITRPGVYIARLDYAIGYGLAERLPMAGTVFEVVIAPLNTVLSLSGGSRESMKVIVNPPAKHSLRSPWDGKHRPLLSLVHLGVTAVGGAVTEPVSLEMSYRDTSRFEDGGSGKMRIYYEGSFENYEARLHDLLTSIRCDWSGVGCPQLASLAYHVAPKTKSPFPLGYGGLGPTDIRSDIPIKGGIWPPIGEHLLGAECKPRIVPVEKMDLRFVRWEAGKYVPVGHALKFGEAFYIEGSLKDPAIKNSYLARMASPNGTEEEVVLFRTEDDPKRVRSELLYFIWDSPEEEADGAAQ